MQRSLSLSFALVLMIGGTAWGQSTDLLFNVPTSDDIMGGYSTGIHSGARTVVGPYDLDGDGAQEILLSDYTGGGRVHVIENVGVNTWELVYSTPFLDSTATTNNIRAIIGGDLDGDGAGEIMFLAGRSYSEFNPNIASLPPGLYSFEFTGTDNDYGTAPASINEFNADLPDRWRTEQMQTLDVDGDGLDEVLIANNGGDNRYDNWYVYGVSGDIGSGFEVWVEELRLSSRASQEFDPVSRGGGSPYSILAADVDGDGSMELAMHSWNSYNFTMADVTGPDAYAAPDSTAENVFVHFPDPNVEDPDDLDQVSFFGGVVVDIDGNGDDEVVYANLQTGSGSVLNYEEGEDPLQITEDNLAVAIIPGFSGLGLTAGDLDGDGQIELIGSGPSFSAESFVSGGSPAFIRIAEYNGGDVEDPASYSTVEEIDISQDFDFQAFDTVNRDSAGVMTTFNEAGGQGPEFVAKLAFLGDPDGDGANEVALSFQGVDDSTYVYNEVFNPDDSTYVRTVESATVNENRVFLRVISGDGFSVKIEDERIVVPSDYELHGNYPNPFNPSTNFSFKLPIDKNVSVKVYDISGRLVDTLVNNERLPAGKHEVTWDATGFSSGTYVYTLEFGNFRQSRQMVLLK